MSSSSLYISISLLFLVNLSSAFEIQQACNATEFAGSCLSSLPEPYPATAFDTIQSALTASSQAVESSQDLINSVLENASASNDTNSTTVAETCLLILSYSHNRTLSAYGAMSRGETKDARAWVSAALGYQYDCWVGFKNTARSGKLANATTAYLEYSVQLSSNVLSMMGLYDNFGEDTVSWALPATERDGFWEKTDESSVGGDGLFSDALDYLMRLNTSDADVTVCKAGNNENCTTTVQEAVNAAPDNGTAKFIIYIKEGVYEEIVRIPFTKNHVVFLGDGMGKTIITGSLSIGQPGMTTYNSATLGVVGDGFMARGLTIENTAGPDAHQAVAFRSSSDLSVIYDCELTGNQDTLYAHSLRQYYKSCRIEGNIDFIFGNSASVFQDCNIMVSPRLQNSNDSVIAAHGRTNPAQTTGLVFQNCTVNGTQENMTHSTHLGRPWKEYSRIVFLHSYFEDIIAPDGWMPWSGDFALPTLYFGEFENSGPGSNTSARVPWSSIIPPDRASTYSPENFIRSRAW